MQPHSTTAALVGALALFAAAPAAAADWDRLRKPITKRAGDVDWQEGPASLPEGAELALLEGDPTKAEPYAFRLRLPDGYRVAPHSHPVREHITVLSGTLSMGLGDRADEGAMEDLGAGAFFVLPAGDTHSITAKGETVVQLHGIGPWGIDYVNPEDDPRNDRS
jgi:mannose-6-phosphate isomerase-like protein (cupin superfamily)